MKKRILSIALIVAGILPASAQIPVTDVANLSNNIMSHVQQMAQWGIQATNMANQLTQLRNTYQQAQQAFNLEQQLSQIKGDIRNVAGGVMAPAQAILNQQRSLLQVPTLDQIFNGANPTRSLVTNLRYNSNLGSIGQYFYVGGNIVWRDQNKYKGFEMERKALENQWVAVSEQQQLEATELNEIDRNQRILANQPTEASAQVAQAAIDASRARMETMKLRSERAAAAAENLAQQRELEEKMIAQKASEEQLAEAAAEHVKAQNAIQAQRTFRFTPPPP